MGKMTQDQSALVAQRTVQGFPKPDKVDWSQMPEWLTIEESSTLTGFHPETLRKLAKAGKIGAEKRGGRDWWIDRDKLLEFYKNRRQRGRPPKHHHNGDQ